MGSQLSQSEGNDFRGILPIVPFLQFVIALFRRTDNKGLSVLRKCSSHSTSYQTKKVIEKEFYNTAIIIEVLELEGISIWSPTILCSIHSSLTSVMWLQDKVYSSSVTKAIHQPSQPVLLSNCSYELFPDNYHSSSLLQFTFTTTFFFPVPLY